jgi:tetratricopeptide (TPR) repeat protein
MQLCRWDAADAFLRRADALSAAVGDSHLRVECHYMSLTHALYTGAFSRVDTIADEVMAIAQANDDVRGVAIARQMKADVLTRLGRGAEAVPLYQASLRELDPSAFKTEVVWALGMLGLAHLQAGDPERAHEAASRALAVTSAARPIAYWLQQSLAATAEVYVTLLGRYRDGGPWAPEALEDWARQACSTLARFSRRIPLGRAQATLWEAGRCWAIGRRRRALRQWSRTIEIAERSGTPWELARAHLALGRRLAPDASARPLHLRRAAETLRALGCTTDAGLALDAG